MLKPLRYRKVFLNEHTMPHALPLSIEIALLPLWLSRLGADSYVCDRFLANPLVFSAWYALMGAAVDWPEEAQAIRDAERAKKLSFERATSLLNKMNHALGNDMDVEHARRVLEGYAIQEWAQRHPQEFVRTMQDCRDSLGRLEGMMLRELQASKLEQFAQVLQLKDTEKKVLTLAVACTASSELRSFLEQLMQQRRTHVAQLWETMLGCTSSELSHALSSRGVLRKSQLLKAQGDAFQLPAVSAFWVAVLSDPLESLFDRLLKPLAHKAGAGIPARLAPADLELASELLSRAREPGVNLLLYGADGLEKRTMLAELLERSGKQGFVLQELESSWQDTPCAAYVAQRLLFDVKGHDAVLVIEKPADVLERKPSEFLRMMFGLELDSSHITPFDELVLSTNPAATVWAGPGSAALPEECVARFVFHAPLKKARKEERRVQLQAYLDGLSLSKGTREELLQLEEVSALQLETALRAAKLTGVKSRKERETLVVQAVRRSLKALQREERPVSKECVTQYSLKYVNHAGRFGPLQILKALKQRPKASLCLYGPPGTGKTQFVEYLAQELGQRLVVKRASDLMSKWVGENEQNIAKMFAEAEAEETVLFLDEGDSFLRDRNLAQASWEVTKVNELLQHMERFPGIFIVATNLFQGLDAAALRRFTFKLEFRALDPDQRWDMFVNEAGLKGKLGTLPQALRDSWWETLCFMPHLAAGDFATVKRQCILLDEVLTPEQWLEQLRIECDVKSEARRHGEAPKMGG